MSLLFSCVVPHPPVLLPEVGQEMAREVEPTVEALQELGKKIASFEPETLVLMSPHGPLFRDSMAIGLAAEARGDFANFGAPEVRLHVPCDVELARAIQQESGRVALPVTPVDALTGGDSAGSFYLLDHGAAVPLHYLLPFLPEVRVVLLGYSYQPRATHQAFGERIRRACDESTRRAVFVASGDLSHRLLPTAPAGYDPQGRVFDEEIVAGLAAGDWPRIRALSPELVERAGVCGYMSILTLAGVAGEQVNTRVLSYQGPFGVGYLVAEVEPQPKAGIVDAAPAKDESVAAIEAAVLRPFAFSAGELGEQLLALARASLETYVSTGSQLQLPLEIPESLRTRQSCFVTLRSHGDLRGCVGTITPGSASLAQEVVENALGAGTRDYRFSPVRVSELGDIRYSVDVLSPAEEVSMLDDFDPATYGMIVMQDPRVGVLLPAIPEIQDAAQQYDVCCQKAGIVSRDNIRLYRFTVSRYAEPGAEH